MNSHYQNRASTILKLEQEILHLEEENFEIVIPEHLKNEDFDQETSGHDGFSSIQKLKFLSLKMINAKVEIRPRHGVKTCIGNTYKRIHNAYSPVQWIL